MAHNTTGGGTKPADEFFDWATIHLCGLGVALLEILIAKYFL
jgi:hypothetical protein